MKNLFKLRSRNTESEELGLINNETPFAIREALESLYTNIIYLSIEDKCKKIALTSAFSGEGKSTLSANLAISIATNSEEKKVLLIDMDLRSAGLTETFSIDRTVHGLTEYIAGVDEQPNFIELSDHKITFLSAGAPTVKPQKIISSARMTSFLEQCSERFDYIIIDTPPVNIVSDALLLHDKINGYIVVTRADYSDINETRECINALERVNAEIFGIVLTSLKLKSAGGSLNKSKSKYGKYANNKYMD